MAAPRPRIDGAGTAAVDRAAATVALASELRWGETLKPPSNRPATGPTAPSYEPVEADEGPTVRTDDTGFAEIDSTVG